MASQSGIAWTDATWNPMVGCTHVSPGCDNCYAETLIDRFSGAALTSPAYPHGFTPTFKPQLLGRCRNWSPRRVFVNSLSDLHHPDFDDEQVAAVYDQMLVDDRHDYVILTKRPQRMARFLTGQTVTDQTTGRPAAGSGGWLARRALPSVPAHIWIGTSIESDEYVWRANWLRLIPAQVRVISAEPLLGPLDGLDLAGIAWLIVGGESGPDHRPMDLAWAAHLAALAAGSGTAYFYKQDSSLRSGTLAQAGLWPPTALVVHGDGHTADGPVAQDDDTVDVIPYGRREFPLPHPTDPARPGAPVGRYPATETPDA